MSDEPHLDQIQRWMQSVIAHPDGIKPGIDSDEARSEIDIPSNDVEQVICRSQALTSIERLEVYGNAYYARLLECLRETFPALVHALGEETFDEFAFGYLQDYPSTSYTLGRLGDHFARHLQETRPDAEAHQRGEVDWPDFLIDLATFEWTIEQVFDGPGVEKEKLLDAETLHEIPPERWPEARLVCVECLRLLEFRYPVNSYYTAYRREEEPETPEPGAEYVAITRRDYVVRRFELERTQFELVSALASGATIGDAVAGAAVAGAWGTTDDGLETLAAKLRRWFSDWTAAGFFQAVELPK